MVNKNLLPLSWLYGMGVGFRNLLFEMGVLKSHAFKVPVISVGNITVGGTGKTPHVEYLIRLLKDQQSVAVLSRGYKRKSRGFLVATPESTMFDLGDEPFQMKRKFPDVTIAVDKKRVRGISRLESGDYTDSEIDVVLLDDAFQHRYVKPGINILLVDYNRLIIEDALLPAGRLREPITAKDRADIVIVTKCPKGLKPMEFRVLTKQMNLYPYQQLFFTTLDYAPLTPVFPEASPDQLTADGRRNVLLLTGIANPSRMEEDLKTLYQQFDVKCTMHFADHHNFSKRDIRRINESFASMDAPKLLITTEKDAARLVSAKGLSDEVRSALYALPIKVSFLLDSEQTFNEKIIDYVHKNSRNSILAKRKDASKPKDGNHPGDRPRTISFRNN